MAVSLDVASIEGSYLHYVMILGATALIIWPREAVVVETSFAKPLPYHIVTVNSC